MVVGIESNISKLRENSVVSSFLDQLMSFGPALIVGGAVRDWIVGQTHRDINVVIDCPTKKLEDLTKCSARKNRFEGFYLKIGGTEFDVWSVESTWAIKQDINFDKTLEAIPRTVFLTMDAVGYRMDTKEIYDSGLHQTIATKRLGIVYEPNPFPYLCVSRALHALVKYDLTPTLNLKRYIEEQMGRGYGKKSFLKYLDMKNIQGDYEKSMERVSHGS